MFDLINLCKRIQKSVSYRRSCLHLSKYGKDRHVKRYAEFTIGCWFKELVFPDLKIKITSVFQMISSHHLPYLWTNEHVTIPVYRFNIQLVMGATAKLYPLFAFFEASFRFWKRDKLYFSNQTIWISTIRVAKSPLTAFYHFERIKTFSFLPYSYVRHSLFVGQNGGQINVAEGCVKTRDLIGWSIYLIDSWRLVNFAFIQNCIITDVLHVPV